MDNVSKKMGTFQSLSVLFFVLLVVFIGMFIIKKAVSPIVQESLPIAVDIASFEPESQYGVLPDGTFFVHKDLVLDADSLTLVILPAETTHNQTSFLEPDKKDFYRMVKIGDYYFAKPDKKSEHPLYYFKSGATFFPAINPMSFSDKDMLVNEYDGIVLMNNRE